MLDRLSVGCFSLTVTIAVVLSSGLFVVGVQENETVAPASMDVRYKGVPYTRLADGGFVLGEPDAPLTIIEFGDFFCHICQDYETTVLQFIDTYVVTGQARFEYRLLPTYASEFSTLAAQLIECVVEQDERLFWPAREMMFIYASGAGADENIGRHAAEELGLDYDQLLACSSTAQQYTVDQQLAFSLGVSGTPSIRVRYGEGEPQLIDQYVTGEVPYEVLEAIILAEQQ